MWLAAFLVAGLVRLGDLSLQWPVLVVPLLWALVALRPRRRSGPVDGHLVRTDTVQRPALPPPMSDGRP